MKLKNVLFSVALISSTALVTATVVSQDKPAAGHEQDWSNPAMEPGEHHKKLQEFVGKWNYELKHWTDPSSEPHTMSGTSEYEWILDGHYLKGKITGDFGGETFEGLEIMGYDNMRNEYFSIWIDNMATGYAISKGNFKGDQMVMRGTMDDPMSGTKDLKTRSVGGHTGDGKMKHEMFITDATGKEVKAMEIVSTRAK